MKITKQMNGGDVITCPTFHMGKGSKPTKRTDRIAMNLKRLPFGLFWYIRFHKLRVCLDGRVEKWEDKKLWEDEKVEGWKIFSFPSYVFGWRGEKVGEWKTILFGLREKWKDENVIYINWLLYPCYIIY